MKKHLLFIAFATLILGCNNEKKDSPASEKTNEVTKPAVIVKDNFLVTDSSWGIITEKTSKEELVAAFGAENVKDETICGPECIDSIRVTKVFPGTQKEFVIHWKDNLYHKSIRLVESNQQEDPHYSSYGIKRKTSLKELLTINGKKISFMGFGWDYGGYIQSYNGGKLSVSKIRYRLECATNENKSLFGDYELDTDMPDVDAELDNIFVSHLSLSFIDETP
ncbi:MAG: hypothetical protein IPH18_04205 [Chitinophagaceae bacterium]|nr:hypothetical protein [Chitinophagaceae bacterium]MBK8953879.1 hypothetical protein [Chitinophagaceae bacterium]